MTITPCRRAHRLRASERPTKVGSATRHSTSYQRSRRRTMGQKARVDLVLDCSDPAKLVNFWREALHYREYYTDTSFAVLVPKEGIASPLVLQGVPEPKAG